MNKTLLLLSGGINSSVCLLELVKSGCTDIHTVTFSYKKENKLECEQAAEITKFLNVRHEIVYCEDLTEGTVFDFLLFHKYETVLLCTGRGQNYHIDEFAKRIQKELNITVEAPFAKLNKDAVILRATNFGKVGMEILSKTQTCEHGLYPPCGMCTSCVLRRNAFSLIGIIDPIEKELQIKNL